MFTPLRRYEFGKAFLGRVPIVAGGAIVSKLFTNLTPKAIFILLAIIFTIFFIGILIMPPSMDAKKEK